MHTHIRLFLKVSLQLKKLTHIQPALWRAIAPLWHIYANLSAPLPTYVSVERWSRQAIPTSTVNSHDVGD